MIDNALVFENVHFAYNGKPVLDGIDFHVPNATVTALMGPSGCGKSTLVAIAAGLLEPASGTVTRRCPRIGIMFQDPLLLPWRTALDNVAFVLKAEKLSTAERRELARTALARVGLEGEDIAKYPRQLSGGMRQRVALARALVIEPNLLLLDEPFSGLDAALAHQMLTLVRSLVERDGVSALVVTHDAREAARFAEQVVVLSASPARLIAARRMTDPSGVQTEAEVANRAGAILASLP